MEFKRGDQLQEWGAWLNYPTDFPNGVNFIAGESDPAQDWFYAQCAATWVPPYDYREWQIQTATVPDWKITFDYDGDASENTKGYLSIDFVSSGLYNGSATLKVKLNDVLLAEYGHDDLGCGGDAMLRASRYGYVGYDKKVIEFDTSLLKPTENVVTLSIDGGNYKTSVMYDCLRLEVKNKSDLNGDGKVNLVDMATVAKDWKNCTNPTDADCVNMK